jgi:RNA polymerase sigma-70 factor (ECF subfamily)
VTAVRRIRRFDPARAGFDHWLRGIAVNVLRNHRRKRGRERRERGEAARVEAVDAEPARLELGETIALTMVSLPERAQAVLRAKYEEGLSVAEIAERWGNSRKAIESLLARARRAFRETFGKFGGAASSERKATP